MLKYPLAKALPSLYIKTCDQIRTVAEVGDVERAYSIPPEPEQMMALDLYDTPCELTWSQPLT